MSNRETDKSWGMIGFSRVTCRPGVELFGSKIYHDNYITLTLRGADNERRHHENYISASARPLFQIAISQAQFGEMVSSFNIGYGVPCTIEKMPGEEKIPLKRETKREGEKFHDELLDQIDEIKSLLNDAKIMSQHMASKTSATKAERNNLTKKIETIERELFANFPFMIDMFKENMEKIVGEVKCDIDAALTNKVMSAGIEKLVEDGSGVRIGDGNNNIQITI